MKISLGFDSREDLMTYVRQFNCDTPFVLLMKDLEGTDGGYDIRTNVLLLHTLLSEVEMCALFYKKELKHPVDDRPISAIALRDQKGWLHLTSRPPSVLPKAFELVNEGSYYFWERPNEFGEPFRFGPFRGTAEADSFARNNKIRTR